MVTRRSFIEGAALAAGACAAGGCATMFGNSAFYGPTIRDRLWMWGHHVDSSKYAGRCAGVGESFKWPGQAVDQAEGCRLIFHPTFAAALDVPAVRLSKEWIAEHGDGKSG